MKNFPSKTKSYEIRASEMPLKIGRIDFRRARAAFRQRIVSWLGISAVLAAATVPVITFFTLPGLAESAPDGSQTRLFLAANAFLGLVLFVLVTVRLVQLHRAKRRGIPGAEMHWRVASLFGLIASIPVITVAAFALKTVDRGLDTWFNQRSNLLIDSLESVSDSYFGEYWGAMRQDMIDVRRILVDAAQDRDDSDGLTSEQYYYGRLVEAQRTSRRLAAITILDQGGNVLVAGRQEGVSVPALPSEALRHATEKNWVRLPADSHAVAGALVSLNPAGSMYLAIHRKINTDVVQALRMANAERQTYISMRDNSLEIKLTYALVLLVLSLAFLLAAMWAGLWQANRIVEPVNHLAAAARRISDGDLDVRVPTAGTRGDLAHLSDTFNRMTNQIAAQQDDLERAWRQADARRGIIEAVLSSLSAGVIGFDRHLRVSLINQAALQMFAGRETAEVVGMSVHQIAPKLAPFLEQAVDTRAPVYGRITVRQLDGEHHMRLLVTREQDSIVKDPETSLSEDNTDVGDSSNSGKIDPEGQKRSNDTFDRSRDIGAAHRINANAAAIAFAHSNLEEKRLSRAYSSADKGRDVDDHTSTDSISETLMHNTGDGVGAYGAKSGAQLEQPFVVTLTDVTSMEAAQRAEAWSEVARRIAHEIKNPLTPIQLAAERLQSRYAKMISDDDNVFDKCTETIIRQVEALGTMVNEFSSYTRLPRAQLVREDLCDLVRQIVWDATLSTKNVDIQTAFPDESVFAMVDRQQIAQVITNLVNNGVEAFAQIDPMPKDAAILVSLTSSRHSGFISVADNGAGLPVTNRDRLADPYVTRRVKGTGLGLAIVKKIVEDHDGSIRFGDLPSDSPIASSRGTGAEITVRIPLHDKIEAGADSGEQLAPRRSRRRTSTPVSAEILSEPMETSLH